MTPFSRSKYDSRGRLPYTSSNGLGHTETYATYNQELGLVEKIEGPNGLPTEFAYDGFGRKIREKRADTTESIVRFKWSSGYAPSGAKYLIETETTGSPPSVTFHDSFGRQIHAYSINGGLLNGLARIVGSRTEYDSMGRAFRSSLPFYYGDAPGMGSEVVRYDLLSRPLEVRTATDEVSVGFVTSYVEYAGLTIRSTNAKGIRSDTTRDLQGRARLIVENAGADTAAPDRSEVSYVYDAVGNLTTTSVRREDGSWVTTTLEYDLRGRKLVMIDPDMGRWEYRYNAAGELIWQQDAKRQTTDIIYDVLGRIQSRREAEGTTTWVYDTAPKGNTTWKGKLHTVTGPSAGGVSYSDEYTYDGYGRLQTRYQSINGTRYGITQSYDAQGRVAGITYPTGFKTRNVYNAFGFLKEVRADGARRPFPGEVVADQLLWRADRYSVWGQVDGSTFGNGLTYDRLVSPVTGRTRAITSGLGSGTTVQFNSYDYDRLGNLEGRNVNALGMAEGFGYDGLNRHTQHRSYRREITVTYDALGNIRSKSDVGAYGYNGVGPHAVTSAGGNSYQYNDANGNMTSGAGRTFHWTSSNQLKKIEGDAGKFTEFWFGADRQRVFQKHSDGTRTTYVGGVFEFVQHQSGLEERKHYIMTPLGRTAVRIERNDVTVETRYFHQDQLGSIEAVTDEYGRVEKHFSFDPWGKRMSPVDNRSGTGGKITRGFTDHEELEDFGLIHMNGRVYDPVLGRFLSADPFVDNAGDSQSYNRYSYVSNNPLSNTDPSGYFKITLKGVITVAIIVVVSVATYGAASTWATTAVANGGLGLTAGSAGAAMVGGSAAGFASGFTGSLLNGGTVGDAFKSGLIGGASGAFTAGLLNRVGALSHAGKLNWFERGIAHGLIQGGAAEATGGEFRHGFYSGFAVGAAEMSIATWARGSDYRGIAAAAVIGGTASSLGGGKFGNGAMSGAFSYLFNQLSQRQTNRFLEMERAEYEKELLARAREVALQTDEGKIVFEYAEAEKYRFAFWDKGFATVAQDRMTIFIPRTLAESDVPWTMIHEGRHLFDDLRAARGQGRLYTGIDAEVLSGFRAEISAYRQYQASHPGYSAPITQMYADEYAKGVGSFSKFLKKEMGYGP